MTKKYERGLVIGKFYPFHKGHQFLLETALSQCERVTVIVCHTKKYTINPKIRAGWIKELYPQVKVIIFRHDPSLDSASPNLSKTWAKITIKLLGHAPDAVFTSEVYGQPYARHMGATHVSVDPKRSTIPISATLIRSNPYRYWRYLSEPVRAYYAKRIVVLGAESTGTTTLAKDLAKHYKTVWIPEYGRTYCEGRLTGPGLKKWTTGEFAHIAGMQNSFENALARKSNRLVICDTDAFATRLWHDRYMGYLSQEVDKVAKTKNKSLYIVTGDEIPFVQDGLRDGRKIRHQMHQKFIRELEDHHLRYILATGSRQTRLTEAIRAINATFREEQNNGLFSGRHG